MIAGSAPTLRPIQTDKRILSASTFHPLQLSLLVSTPAPLSLPFFPFRFIFFPSHPDIFLPKQTISSSPSKSRKAHFTATSSERRKIMSAPLSKALREQFGARSMPIRKGDTVKIVRGPDSLKGKEGQVKASYRKRYCILIESVERNNAKGVAVNIPIAASNVVIVDLKTNGNRIAILDRKKAGRAASAAAKKA